MVRKIKVKRPKRGDRVFVPDLDGTWINGIVNAVTDGRLLVGVAGHQSGAQLVTCDVKDYLTQWAWPKDMPVVQSRLN